MGGDMVRVVASWLLLVVLISPCGALTFRDRLHGLVSKGNRLYDSEQHEAALKCYRSAIEVDSTHAVPHFNAGDAFYRLGKYREGASEFARAITSQSDSIAAMSYYNLGNALFKAGDLQSAVEAYKRSLLINPCDEDAKYNLELALKLLEEQQNRDKQDQQQQQQDQQENERQKEQKQSQSQERENQAQQEQQREQQQEQERQMEINPQDLDRILSAIEASDRDVQQELLKKKMRKRRVRGKDW